MGQHSLRLDAAGRPRIAYGGDHLYYAWYDGAAWHTETADNAPSVGRYASLALDAAGYPHISYYDLANKDLKYTRWTGTTWSTQTVDSAGDVGQYTALALDAAGNPHIGYYDNTNGHPKYAAWTGSAWTIQTVDSAPMGGWCTVPLARPNTCACERASHPTSGLSLVTPSSSRSWAVILKSTTCWLSIWCLTGNIKTLPPKGEFHCELEMGTLVPAEAKRKGFLVVNVTDPASPAVTRTYLTPPNVVGLAVSGTDLYAAAGANVWRYGLADPARPALLNSFGTAGSFVAVQGSYVYIGDFQNKLYIYDITNPAAPQQRGVYTANGTVKKLAIQGRYAHLLAAPWGSPGYLPPQLRLTRPQPPRPRRQPAHPSSRRSSRSTLLSIGTSSRPGR
jgi:hypothetical protein